jgi:hypothetical protein
MARKTISVYKRGDSWIAKKPENDRPSAVKDNQKEAYLAAKRIALREGRSITVYYSSGQKKVIVPKDTEEDDCFITTACVKYFKLSDDCEQLTILRNFRDNYLKKTRKGCGLIELYYEVAPRIIVKISKRRDKKEIYSRIFAEINLTCQLIRNRRYTEATEQYTNVVSYLINF